MDSVTLGTAVWKKLGDLQHRQKTAGRMNQEQQAVGAFAEDLAGLGRGQ